jgi:hypothetical protein
MPYVIVKIEVYPEDHEKGEIKYRELGIEADHEEFLGKEYVGNPDALGGAMARAYEKASTEIRKQLWEKYPPKEEEPVEGQYYVGYPCSLSVIETLQQLTTTLGIDSSVYHGRNLMLDGNELVALVIGPLDTEGPHQQAFEAALVMANANIIRSSKDNTQNSAGVATLDFIKSLIIAHVGQCSHCGEWFPLDDGGKIFEHPINPDGIAQKCQGAGEKPIEGSIRPNPQHPQQPDPQLKVRGSSPLRPRKHESKS